MWLMFRKYRYIGSLLLLIGGLSLTWLSGYGTAKSKYQAKISALQADYAQQTAKREQQLNQQLQAALSEQHKWQQFSQEQGVKLAQAQQKLDRQAVQQQKEIKHVIEKDKESGIVYNGIGDDSLQIYNRALGYPTPAPY